MADENSRPDDDAQLPPEEQEEDAPDDFELEADEETPPEEIDLKPPPREPSRADRRIQALAEERRAEKERADRLERELQEFRQNQQRLQSQQQEKVPTAEEMSMWSDDQKNEYRQQQSEKKFNTQMQQLAYATFESNDRLSFSQICQNNPVAARYRDDVEALVADRRRNGETVPREVALKFIIGDKIMRKGPQSVKKQKQESEERVRKQTTRPSNPSSDRGSQRGRLTEAQAREKRLENIKF